MPPTSDSPVERDPCDGFACALPSRCVAWASGPRCVARAEDALPWWPDDACDSASCPPETLCSLAGAGFECLPVRHCRAITADASPECPSGQRCTPACVSPPCTATATRPFCAFDPPRVAGSLGPTIYWSSCVQYLDGATACLPADWRDRLAGVLHARLERRFNERQDGAARVLLENQCSAAAGAMSTWCEVPASASARTGSMSDPPSSRIGAPASAMREAF